MTTCFFRAAGTLAAALVFLAGCDSAVDSSAPSFADVTVTGVNGPSAVGSGQFYTFSPQATQPLCAVNENDEVVCEPFDFQISLEPLPSGTQVSKTSPTTFTVRYRTFGPVPQHTVCITETVSGSYACKTVN